MIPQDIRILRPAALQEALALIAPASAKILAGGMSLIPLMKLRLAHARSRWWTWAASRASKHIAEAGGVVHIGAMATHHEIETSPVVRARCPLLAETASHIGDVQVRNMGTIGGSIAHADPAADYPAALLALEAQIRLVSAHSDRTVAASEFFLDAFTTALEPGEIVLEVQVPVEDASEGYRYEKVPHPASGFAVVGVAVRIKTQAGRIAMARIGVTGMGSHAFRARAAEKLLEDGAAPEQAAAVVGEGEEANSDLYASADYRRHLARVHAAPRAGRGSVEGLVKISGAYALPVAQERAYRAAAGPRGAGPRMPGCESLELIGENEYAMRMKMVLASMSGLFEGKVRISDSNPPASFRLMVEGQGKIGFMKGEGLLTLTPAGDSGCNVQYDGDVQVGGTIAAVGQRLLDTTARLLIKRFFEKLSSEASAVSHFVA